MTVNLDDDDLKLVAYSIVFSKPGHEQVMPLGEGSLVVTDRLTEAQTVSFVIAKYLKEQMPSALSVLKTPDDFKHLRVHIARPASWPQDPPRTSSRQSEALERVSAALAAKQRK